MGGGETGTSKDVNGGRSSWSFLDLYNHYLCYVYRRSGLVQKLVKVSPETRMQCWVPGSPAHGQRPALLLLHGFGAGATPQWNKQVPVLAKHVDLYVPDLVFFGGSHTTSLERSEEFQARCIHKLMEALDVPRFLLLGYSYGGSIAYKMAHMFPTAVESLIIIGSCILSSSSDVLHYTESLGLSPAAALHPKDVAGVRRMLQLAYHRPPWVPEFILKDVLRGMFTEDAEASKQELMAESRKKISMGPAEVPRVHQDTLILVGEFDPLAPIASARRLQSHIGEHAKVVVVPQTAHMPQAERPKEVNSAVLAFLLSA